MEPLTKDGVNSCLGETLTPILAEHGFMPHPHYPRRFQRKIEGGYQEIHATAISSGPLMPIMCLVNFEQHSERITAIRRILDVFDEKTSKQTYVFYFCLRCLRNMMQPERKNLMSAMPLDPVLSQKDVDRIIGDVPRIGLPFLNRFRNFSVDDADRLFNEPNEFTGELFKESGKSMFYIANALIYARLAGKMDFEAVVRRFAQFIDTHEKYSDKKEEYAKIAEACRRYLLPMNGSEPA
jgi:hypothetical protein